jgi:tRNA uridine 5-carboxymethylaminomethyl modification enzyme
MREFYDVIVIGGGHAGAEAAWAAASVLASRGDSRVALITMDPSRIGTMSCNPAIGGLAKGQMVREIDALGGLMGLATDATGIMFKMLNTSKGAAVRGPRAQCDKYAYAAEVQRLIAGRPNIDVIAGTIDDIVVEDGRVVGVVVPAGAPRVEASPAAIEWNHSNAGLAQPPYASAASGSAAHAPMPAHVLVRTHALVLTTGTFMRALMHTGESRSEGGRIGEGSAVGMSATLQRLGFQLGRLKTGTPPRLARQSLDWDGLPRQHGDENPVPFSDLSNPQFPPLPQVQCRITATTAAAHDLIRANIHRAPMYSGQISAECGPRYCPSIEDKVVRFADRDSHHVFLEPESLHTSEIYCNGISTSLPEDVQELLVRSMSGCQHARILRWGYAVEYDMIWPHQIDSTCMAKHIIGLFPAGQINGTSGYEEAAGQGLVAGLNAARLALAAKSLASSPPDDLRERAELIRLGRDQAYIGVMMDDLVTKTPREPYRMFTSRAEHRLLLRADNADERLTTLARKWGLVDDERWRQFEHRSAQLAKIAGRFDHVLSGGRPLRELARRPETTADQFLPHFGADVSRRQLERVMADIRYEGYIARQRMEIRRQSRQESQALPEWLRYETVSGLRAEAVQTLAKFRPATLGQAARLAGVNPADLTLIAVALKRGKREIAVRENR